jgi:hypothetical protein
VVATNSQVTKRADSMSGLKEVLPKFGLVYSDRGNLVEIMSKPKLIPIKVHLQTHVFSFTRRHSRDHLEQSASVKELEKREKALATAPGGLQ